MNLSDKIKQMWISLKLEQNPHYYTVVDIQECMDELHKIMTGHKLDRTQMREATCYLASLREYKNVVSLKSTYSQTVNMKALINDVYMEINTVSRFIKSVTETEHELKKKSVLD